MQHLVVLKLQITCSIELLTRLDNFKLQNGKFIAIYLIVRIEYN